MFAAGAVVLQPLSFDPKSACIALHEIMRLRIPRYCHIGISDGNGRMYTASGRVMLQDAGATGNLARPYPWKDWKAAEAWLQAQIGKPYDWGAWAICALSPIVLGLNHLQTGQAYTCSSLVGMALALDGNTAPFLRSRIVTPDDIAGVIGSTSL